KDMRLRKKEEKENAKKKEEEQEEEEKKMVEEGEEPFLDDLYLIGINRNRGLRLLSRKYFQGGTWVDEDCVYRFLLLAKRRAKESSSWVFCDPQAVDFD
ncbi:hypothetical protein ALC60_07993, partial [Trachymyrmex zeteki]